MCQVCREKRKEVKLGRKRKKEIGGALEKRKERKKGKRKGKREKKEEINLVGRRGKKLGSGKETSSVSHMTNL